jgi:hypothetical protein
LGLCTFEHRIRAFDGLSFLGFGPLQGPSTRSRRLSFVRADAACAAGLASRSRRTPRAARSLGRSVPSSASHFCESNQPVHADDLAVIVGEGGLGSSVSKVSPFDSLEDEPAGIPSPAWFHPCGWAAAKSVQSGSCAASFRFNGIRVPMNRLRAHGCPWYEEGVDSRPSWGS